jgi:hypothetical protein
MALKSVWEGVAVLPSVPSTPPRLTRVTTEGDRIFDGQAGKGILVNLVEAAEAKAGE